MRIKLFILFILILQKTIARSDGELDRTDTTLIPPESPGGVNAFDLTTEGFPFNNDEAELYDFLNHHVIDYDDYAYYEEYTYNEDIEPTSGNGDIFQTTKKNGIPTTDNEHTIKTDSALKSSTENETGDELNGTDEKKSSKEHKWLTKESALLASGCTIGGVCLTLAVVFVRKKWFNHQRRSNGEVKNRKTDGCNVATRKEQTKENAYYIVVDETKRELPNFSDPKSSAQESYSTLTFIMATHENEYLELKKEPTENEYDCVNQNY